MPESSKCNVKRCTGEALHELPADVDERRIWIDALNLEEVNYAPKTRVMCTQHFQLLDTTDFSSLMVSSSKGSSTTSSSSYDDNHIMDDPTSSFETRPASYAANNMSARSNTSGTSSYDEDDIPQDGPRVGLAESSFPTKASLKKRLKPSLSAKATTYLKSWLLQHVLRPYPTEKEKIEIASETGLTAKQVCNWFINARRRIIKPMLDSPNGCSASSCPLMSDVNALVDVTPQQIGYIPRKQKIPKSRAYEAGGRSVSVDSTETPTSTTSHSSIFDADAPKSPDLNGATNAKKPRILQPSKVQMKKEAVSTATSLHIDLKQPPTINVSSSTAPDSSSSVHNGMVNANVQKALKNEPATRVQPRKSRSRGKNVIKVVIPAAQCSRIILRKRSKTVTVTSTVRDSQLQATSSDSSCIQKTDSAKKSTHAADYVPYHDGVTSNVASPSGNTSGEGLLNSLYEELYVKSETNDDGSGNENEVQNRVGGASTSRQTQTHYEQKHRETQTQKSIAAHNTPGVRIAALTYVMYIHKPDWLKYHTGLANYEQFKLVLDSLGSGVFYLADRYSTPEKPLCAEDQLLMTLMKFCRAEPDLGIAIVFGVPKKTVEDIVKTWTNIMYRRWSVPNVWPTEELTARKICRSVEGPNSRTPLNIDVRPSDCAVLRKVRQHYKILNVKHAHHKPFSDKHVLFVCCMLFDFRAGVIATRKP